MNTSMDSIDYRPPLVEEAAVVASDPRIIILQPEGCLDAASSSTFLLEVERALEQRAGAVIIDLLRVEAVRQEGIHALLTAMQWAAQQNQALSICAMSMATRTALASEWDGYWLAHMGQRVDCYQQEFEKFLQSSSWARQQADTASAIAPNARFINYATAETDLHTQQTA